ncbi:hypothetical protein, conserved [Eimeria necatrix]|uniref:Uncharacterized protein n=1 Tax=Eimeria necatrix TaxID=51315 RepID=U6MFR0_9EIME|nr:hypothetical protein, conserved [Eimeria necatrix]CDJ63052.1 hypothetical protein, conserved [Eimeria necatrix]
MGQPKHGEFPTKECAWQHDSFNKAASRSLTHSGDSDGHTCLPPTQQEASAPTSRSRSSSNSHDGSSNSNSSSSSARSASNGGSAHSLPRLLNPVSGFSVRRIREGPVSLHWPATAGSAAARGNNLHNLSPATAAKATEIAALAGGSRHAAAMQSLNAPWLPSNPLLCEQQQRQLLRLEPQKHELQHREKQQQQRQKNTPLTSSGVNSHTVAAARRQQEYPKQQQQQQQRHIEQTEQQQEEQEVATEEQKCRLHKLKQQLHSLGYKDNLDAKSCQLASRLLSDLVKSVGHFRALIIRYRELQQRLREETVAAAAAAAGQQREAAEAEKYKREAEAVHRQLRQQQRHQQQLQEELRSCRALVGTSGVIVTVSTVHVAVVSRPFCLQLPSLQLRFCCFISVAATYPVFAVINCPVVARSLVFTFLLVLSGRGAAAGDAAGASELLEQLRDGRQLLQQQLPRQQQNHEKEIEEMHELQKREDNAEKTELRLSLLSKEKELRELQEDFDALNASHQALRSASLKNRNSSRSSARPTTAASSSKACNRRLLLLRNTRGDATTERRLLLQRCNSLQKQLRAAQAEKEEVAAELKQWISRVMNFESGLQHAKEKATAAEKEQEVLRQKNCMEKIQAAKQEQRMQQQQEIRHLQQQLEAERKRNNEMREALLGLQAASKTAQRHAALLLQQQKRHEEQLQQQNMQQQQQQQPSWATCHEHAAAVAGSGAATNPAEPAAAVTPRRGASYNFQVCLDFKSWLSIIGCLALRLEQEKQRRSDACPASPLRQQQQQQLQQELQQLKLQQQKQQQMEQHLRSQLEAQAMTLAEHRKTVVDLQHQLLTAELERSRSAEAVSALEADKRKAEESIELLQQLLKQSEQQQWQLQRRVEAAEEVAAQQQQQQQQQKQQQQRQQQTEELVAHLTLTQAEGQQRQEALKAENAALQTELQQQQNQLRNAAAELEAATRRCIMAETDNESLIDKLDTLAAALAAKAAAEDTKSTAPALTALAPLSIAHPHEPAAAAAAAAASVRGSLRLR